jgi:hypothetical protein
MSVRTIYGCDRCGTEMENHTLMFGTVEFWQRGEKEREIMHVCIMCAQAVRDVMEVRP